MGSSDARLQQLSFLWNLHENRKQNHFSIQTETSLSLRMGKGVLRFLCNFGPIEIVVVLYELFDHPVKEG